MLAYALEEHEDELRADLQQTYGIDLDHAMAGGHNAGHVAALASQLPHGARVFASVDPDNAWTLEATVMALVANSLNSLIYGMSDKKKRGAPPPLVGPSWMVRGRTSTLDARVLEIGELMEELGKPRS